MDHSSKTRCDTMAKTVDNVDKPKRTLGFSVNEAPIWLCKALTQEADQFYAGAYWPVIVDWHRKAKEMENLMRGGMPSPEDPAQSVEVEEAKEEGVPLFGGHVGKKK